MRVISAGRPQANGQAEIMVRTLKQKMKALMSENTEDLGKMWDEDLLHQALQIVRVDPSSAHGFAPGELLIGRPLVFPIEISNLPVDFSGTELTTTLVDALKKIRIETFGLAGSKIDAYQKRYKKQYDKAKNVKAFDLRRGSPVQVKRHRSKRAKGSKNSLAWFPRNSFYTIHKIDKTRKKVFLKNPKSGKVLTRTQHFDQIRQFKGHT